MLHASMLPCRFVTCNDGDGSARHAYRSDCVTVNQATPTRTRHHPLHPHHATPRPALRSPTSCRARAERPLGDSEVIADIRKRWTESGVDVVANTRYLFACHDEAHPHVPFDQVRRHTRARARMRAS